jgi:hypothetical protein
MRNIDINNRNVGTKYISYVQWLDVRNKYQDNISVRVQRRYGYDDTINLSSIRTL